MKKKILIIWLAVSVTCVGCASFSGSQRDITVPSRALIGHWRMEDGSGEVYFSEDGSYRFFSPDGRGGRSDYRVLVEDGVERTIVCLIRLKEMDGEPVEEEVELMVEGTFSPDYQKHTGKSTEEGGEVVGTFSMEYVDENQLP
jgi:hypothetical protein